MKFDYMAWDIKPSSFPEQVSLNADTDEVIHEHPINAALRAIEAETMQKVATFKCTEQDVQNGDVHWDYYDITLNDGTAFGICVPRIEYLALFGMRDDD